MHAVRYGIPLVLVIAAVIVSATAGRDTEQSARDFFDKHGHWPDEPPSAARGRPRA